MGPASGWPAAGRGLGAEADGELGDAFTEGAGLVAVDLAEVAVGGGAVIGARLAHGVGPGQADEDHAVADKQMHEL